MRLKRKNSGLFIIGLFISIAPVILPSLVYAAATWNLVLNRISTTPVDSGTNIVYELQVQCSAVAEPSCNDGQVVLDIPDDLLGILDLTVQEPNPLISAVTPTPTGATIDLLNPFPAGASGSILFEVTTPNGITPDGYSWTVDATLSGSNTGPDITAQSDGEAQATANLDVVKWGPLGDHDDQVLALGTTIRYYLTPCDPGYSPDDETGALWLENVVLTDTLPAEAVFVAASSGGTHDGAPTGGVVTWNLPDELPLEYCSQLNQDYWVDVQYPGATNLTVVTNTVDLTGTPIGDTVPISADDTLRHGFIPASAAGSIYKRSQSSFDPYFSDLSEAAAGDKNAYWRVGVANEGNISIGYEIVDPIACLDNNVGAPSINTFKSLAPGSGFCLNPAFEVTSITGPRYTDPVTGWNIGGPDLTAAYDAGWRIEYTTNLGTTGVFEKPSSYWDWVPVGLPDGEIIAEITIPEHPLVQLPPNTAANFDLFGIVAEDDPAGTMPEGAMLQNETSATLYSNGQEVGSGTDDAFLQIVPAANRLNAWKYIWDATGIGFRVYNYSADQPVTFTDLLPPGMVFERFTTMCETPYISANLTNCSGMDAAQNYDLEVIENYQGTGRTLVRLTSKPGYVLEGGYALRLDMEINTAGMAPGTHVNDAQVFSNTSEPIDWCSQNTPLTSDIYDLDGDGDFTDTYCQGSDDITIDAAPAFLSSNKQVQGDNDTAFAGFPNVGNLSGGGGSAQYQLTFSNDGTTPLTGFMAYDILPYVNDTGVSETQVGSARDSDFAVVLNSEITSVGLPAGWVVEYSMENDPCRPEVYQNQGACVDDWTSVYSAGATAFRINGTSGDPLTGGSSVVITASVIADNVIPNPGAVAWNSFAVDVNELPTTEPPKVGLGLELSDISLEKNISPAIVAPGEEFNISITVYHDALIVNDPDGSVSYVDRITGLPTNAVFPATNVVVGEILPLGMTIVPGSSPATYNESTNEWTVGDIYPGQSFTLNLTATTGAAGSYTNVAEVTANDTPDIDSFPADDDGDQSDDDEDNADVVAEEPAIDIQKLVESSRDSGGFIEADASDGEAGDYIVGQPIRYRFVVTNPTGLPLTNVVVSDPLIAGFCTPATLTIATLAPGASQTIDCEYPPGFSDTVNPTVNTATVNAEYNDAAIPPDSDTAQIQVTPQLWDLSDAPNSYQTDVTTGGPMHLLNDSTLFLGTQIPDDDINGMPTAGADGDDLNSTSDEDGVTFRAVKSIFADVVVTNNTGGPVTVCAWLDVPSGGVVDGVFDASDGQCQTTSAVNPTLTFEWTGMPIDKAYTTYTRFRVTSDMTMAATDPAGAFADGEVEDYKVDFDFSPTAVTINKVLLNGMSVGEVLAGMGVSLDDTAEALSLLAGWDPDLADSLGAADSETLLAALRDYLDPDGDGRVAVLQWETTAERGTIGFYVERNDDGGQGAWHRINDDMLPGLITAPMGGYYWLADPEARSGVNYLYRMIEQEARGGQNTYGPYPLRLQ